MPLPARVSVYDSEVEANLDDLLVRVGENEKVSNLVERLKFLVTTRSAHLAEWLAKSGQVSNQTVFVVWSRRDNAQGVFSSLADATQHASGLDRIGEYAVGQEGIAMMYSAQGVACGKRRKRPLLRFKEQGHAK